MNITGKRNYRQPEDAVLLESVEEAHKRSGMSQRDFARLIGISDVQLCQYLRGRRRPEFSTSIRIAKALGLDINRLFGLGAP